MKIAIATQNFQTITSHGGRARRFLVFEAVPGQEPMPVKRWDFPEDMILHHFGGGQAHPIDEVEVLIAGSSGQGFINHIGRRGITCVTTSETDPVQAIRDFLAGAVKPAEAMSHPHEHHETDDGEPDTCQGHAEGHGEGGSGGCAHGGAKDGGCAHH